MLKIYLFDRSPFCIAIVQAAHAGGLEPELVPVSNADRSELIRLTNGASYQVARQHGEDIVLEGSFEEGATTRWIFSAITADTFRWRAVESRDGWRAEHLEQETFAQRIAPAM